MENLMRRHHYMWWFRWWFYWSGENKKYRQGWVTCRYRRLL